jgi:hypothetical protein
MDSSETGMSAGWIPDACTLPAGERPLRAAAFDGLFAEAVREVERPGPERLRLALRAGPGVAGRAAELAAAETACCSFFTFTLTISGGGLVVEISVPGARVAVLDALAARAEAAARTAA